MPALEPMHPIPHYHMSGACKRQRGSPDRPPQAVAAPAGRPGVLARGAAEVPAPVKVGDGGACQLAVVFKKGGN